MDLRLKEERIEYHTCVLDRTVEDMFTADVVVPDALADVGEVILMDGDFCLWRLDLGSGSAEAEGEWKGSVCYRTEDSGELVSFPVSVGIRLRVHDDGISPDLRPFAVCRVLEQTAQVMNSRKLRLKVRASMALQGYENRSTTIYRCGDDMPDDLLFKTDTTTMSVVSDVSEQVFTAEGRHSLRETPSGLTILSAHSEIAAEPPLLSGSRAIVNGRIRTTVLYTGEQSGAPVTETLETPFSQLLDLDASDETASLRSRLQITSFELSVRDNALVTDYHIVIQTISEQELSLSLLTDAYSLRGPLELRTEPIMMTHCDSEEAAQVFAEATVPDAPDNSVVLTSFANLASVRRSHDSVSGIVHVKTLYLTPEGNLAGSHTQAEFSYVLQDMCELRDILPEKPNLSKNGETMEVRVPMKIEYARREQAEVRQICGIAYTDDPGTGCDAPSITLVCREEAEDLWECAKAHGSTIEAIQNANKPCDGESQPRYRIVPRVIL